MNGLDGFILNDRGFSFLDITGQDQWITFTPIFGALTVVGATAYSGRLRVIGKMLQFQVQFSAATSIASVAGTDYLTLPRTMQGLSGFGSMTNNTTKINVGLCHLDVTTSRCYLPSQLASANIFTLFGMYEI
jgi:hypothetical protein